MGISNASGGFRNRASHQQISYILVLGRRAGWITNDDWEQLRMHIWGKHRADSLDDLTPVQAGETIRTLRDILGVGN